MTINFDEFIKYFVKKWKIVFVIIMCFACVFAGATKIVGKEINVPHSEEYLYYEKESAWLEEYLEKAILMKLNPTEIHERTIFLENIAQKEKLESFVQSIDIWDDFETEYEKKYLNELLIWSESDNGSIGLTVRHSTEKECLEIAQYLSNKIEEYDEVVETLIGEERITVDEKLQDEQLRWYDRIEYSKSLLLESQAGYTIKVNVVAAAITGIITGGIISFVVVLFMYIATQKSNWQEK